MAVNDPHPQYRAAQGQWQRCDDCVKGTDAVKARTTDYLPRPEGFVGLKGAQQYKAYVTRANFFNGAGRTLDGMLGFVYRKPPQINLPKDLEDFQTDATLQAMSLEMLGKRVTRDVIQFGRVGMLVDWPEDDESSSFADQLTYEAPRAYISIYPALSIVNWRVTKIRGAARLTQVVLREMVEDAAPEFGTTQVEQYRVVELIGGKLWHRVFRKSNAFVAQGNAATRWIEVARSQPTRNGAPLEYVPFTIANASTLGVEVELPPILDLVDVNLSLYRTSADIERGRFLTASPTPWVAGFDTTADLYIGSGKAWVSSDPQARAGFLEYTGQGLRALETAMEEKKQEMIVLGAQLLASPKKAPETADALRVKQSGEMSVLSNIATTASQAIEEAISQVLWWQSIAYKTPKDARKDVTYKLNKDYLDERMTADEALKFVQAMQAGGLSKRVLAYNFERGDLYPPDWTVEDEIAALDKQAQAEPLPLTDVTGREAPTPEELRRAQGARDRRVVQMRGREQQQQGA